MLASLISFIKKYNERATIIGLGLGLVFFVGCGLYLQKRNSHEKEKPPPVEPIKIELLVEDKETSDDAKGSAAKTSTFFLEPSPAALLEQLADMENLQEDVAQAKLKHLRVLWSVYFFSIESIEEGLGLLLDISEDGFGAEVRGTVNSDDYPQLQELLPGDKLWVAGEIVGVDPSGTGTVYLNIEVLDFSEDGPPAATVEPVVTAEKE